MTSHIQIPDTKPIAQYTGNGSQTVYTYGFPIFQAADLSVSIDGTLQIGNYAVTGAGQTVGGTVIFNTAPPDQSVVTIERRLAFLRVSDFIEGGELAANALNSEFDYLTACLQQVLSDTDPMVRFAKEEGMDAVTLPSKLLRANKVLGFDGNGDMVVYETSDTYTSPTVIQSGTGAIARPVGDKAKEIVSVKDFGAVGNNIADDTAALQNAINAHKYVYFPPGTYRITNSIEIGDGKILVGSGTATIVKPHNNTYDALCLIGKAAAVSNLTIDGGDSGLRVYGKAAPATHNLIQNVIVKNANTGIELDGYTNSSNPCSHNSFHHIAIERPAAYGLHVTRSGAGSPPNGNIFGNMRVQSLGTSVSGAGFYLESAKYNNALNDCVAELDGTPVACVRVGAESSRTVIANLRTSNANGVPNVQLEAGSSETIITNLRSESSGAAISDLSGGSYTAFNAGGTEKNRLSRTRITDLTIEQQRNVIENVALVSAGTFSIDLTKSVYLVATAGGATTMSLPKAAAGNNGAVITIKKSDASSNIVTVSENTGTGPDGKSLKMSAQGDTVTVISDGSLWRILSSNLMQRNHIAISGAVTYKPDLSKQLILATTGASITTVELPSASLATSVGRPVTIKKIDAGAGQIRITEEGATGPDNAVQSSTTRYAAWTVMSDGNLWHVISKV